MMYINVYKCPIAINGHQADTGGYWNFWLFLMSWDPRNGHWMTHWMIVKPCLWDKWQGDIQKRWKKCSWSWMVCRLVSFSLPFWATSVIPQTDTSYLRGIRTAGHGATDAAARSKNPIEGWDLGYLRYLAARSAGLGHNSWRFKRRRNGYGSKLLILQIDGFQLNMTILVGHLVP